MFAAIATPVCLLDECACLGSYHVALAPLILRNETYRLFYERMSLGGDYVIVDNGVVEEGESLSILDVVEAAVLVGAKEIILPDCIGSGSRTVDLVRRALSYLNQTAAQYEFKLMAVCHGRDMTDFLRSYLELTNFVQINVLGLSMFLDESLRRYGGRSGVALLLRALSMISDKHEYHLLGCHSDLRELKYLDRDWIRSVDTGAPVRLGLKGIVHPDLESTAKPPPFEHRGFDFEAKYEMNPAVLYNINLYQEMCSDPFRFPTETAAYTIADR